MIRLKFGERYTRAVRFDPGVGEVCTNFETAMETGISKRDAKFVQLWGDLLGTEHTIALFPRRRREKRVENS